MAKRDPAIPHPPVGAFRYRRWRVWYDFGVLDNGACVVETGWYAIAAGQTDIIMSKDWNGVIGGVDEIEAGRGHAAPGPSPLIEYQPPREAATYSFWRPSKRPHE